jgi:hypothetical protein
MAKELEQAGGSIADALKFVAQLQNQATSTQVVKLPERAGVYLLDEPGGAKIVTAAPEWHCESLETPQELFAFTARYKAPRSAVFYNEKGVVFVRDIEDRRDRSICEFETSPQWQWLTTSAKSRIGQADMVLLLRTIFRDAISRDFLNLMRSLKFQAGQQTTGQYGQGSESLGRAVQAQTEQVMPEEITLSVPIFENYRRVAPVTCALEVFPQEANFRITPLPQQIKAAMDSVLEAVADIFRGEDPDDDTRRIAGNVATGAIPMPPVFRGRP